MRYSIEPRFRKYVKGYGFLSLARTFGNKYGKNLMDTVTETGVTATKTSSKRVVQKYTEATGALITSIGKPKDKEKANKVEELYIPPKRDKKLLMTLNYFEHKM